MPSRRPGCEPHPYRVNLSDPFLQPFNGTHRKVGATPTLSSARAAALCKQPPAESPGHEILESVASCSAPSLQGTPVRLLVGVMSTPERKDRRDAARDTWARKSSSSLVCFAVGRRGPAKWKVDSVDEEERAHNDIVWLRQARDGCSQFMLVEKAFFWWRQAWRLVEGSAVRHVAKIDDDSLLGVVSILSFLSAAHCHAHLLLGPIARAGFNPSAWDVHDFRRREGAPGRHGPSLQCGFNPSSGKEARCSNLGYHPSVAFPLGALELLSVKLVQYVARDPSVFNMIKAYERHNVVVEDPLLGYWLKRSPFDVIYVNTKMRELRCRGSGHHTGQRRPLSEVFVVHGLKAPEAQHVVWHGLEWGERPGDPVNQTRETCARWSESFCGCSVL